MFSKSKSDTKGKKMAHENSGQPAINIISEGTTISGKINTQNDFRVAGKVEGELNVKGKCIVTQSGHITGDLIASDADISGITDGNLVVANKLFLRQSAHVKGDIHTKTLLIEEGAVFEGVCRMSDNPLKNTKEPKTANTVNGSDKEANKDYKPGFKLEQK
jgi:cytoskeletal protein CcmA (bactofilin family)